MHNRSNNLLVILLSITCVLIAHSLLYAAQKHESFNLAASEFGAILLPSSQSGDVNLQVERSIDGNIKTNWVSDIGTYPNWIEVRWQQPVSVNRITIDFAATNQMDNYKLMAWVNGKWMQVLDGKLVDGEKLDRSFKNLEALRVRFYMYYSDKGVRQAVSSINELKIFGCADWVEACKQMTKPWWKSAWIWYPEGEISEVDRYFRKHFRIYNLNLINQALLQIGADDSYDLYLNEHQIAKGGWVTTQFDVKKYLKSGDNLIAVKCHEDVSFEGLIAELTLNKSDGSIARIFTDKTWQSYNKDSGDWYKFSNDESEWKPVKEQGIPPNCTIRTDQPYIDVAAKQSFYINSFRTLSKAIPGKRVELEFAAQVKSVVHEDYGFVVRVGDKSLSPTADYTVAKKEFLPLTKTSKWVPGKTYKLSTSIYIPDWAPHGNVSVSLIPTGKGVEGCIGNTKDNIVGSLNIRKFASDPKPWPAVTPKTEVKLRNGNPTLYVNGKVLNPYIMSHPDYATYEAFGEQAKPGCRIWRILGVKMVNCSYETQQGRKENIEYFKIIDQLINNVLKVNPDAYILAGSIVQAAPEWTDRYPNDATLLSNGRRLQYSLSSRRWARQLDYDYRALVKHMMKQKYSGHIIGVHYEMAQETNYWGYGVNDSSTPRNQIVLGDYSAEHIRAFREWLKERYRGDVASLRSAWKDKSVDFDTAYPKLDTLCAEDTLMFKDPAKTQMPMDYWEFHSEEMVNMSNVVARAVKEASGGKYITGLWGFYSDGVYDGPNVPGKMQYMGHTAIQKALDSPYIDYLAMIQSYTHRRWGRPMYAGNLVESIRKHGKMPLVEFDVRTFFTPVEYDMRTYSQPESISVMQSYIWGAAIRGDALWWVGFSRGITGRPSVPWYAEKSLTDLIGQGKRLYDVVYNTVSPSNSEVAVFMSDDDMRAMDVYDGYKPLISAQYQTSFFETTKLGAPVDYYELNDISLNCMDQYKVYVFLNAYNLTKSQRDAIKARVRRVGKTAVWLYGAGYNNGATISESNIQDLTGISTGCTIERRLPTVKFEPGHPLTTNLLAGYTLQPQRWEYDLRPYEIGPIFYVNDPSAEVLGKYEHNGQTAYASKIVDGGRSIFLAIPYISSSVLRDICRVAGVSLYTQNDTYLDSTRHFILITNTENDFNQTITLPQKTTVYDISSNLIIARNVSSFTPKIAPFKSSLYFTGTDSEVAAFISKMAH